MKNRLLRSATIIVSFLLCLYLPKIFTFFFNIPGSKLFITSLGYPFTIIIIIVSFYILNKYNIVKIISELGLKEGFTKGFLFGLVVTLPMTVSSFVLFKFSDNLFSYYTLIAVFIGPVMEELLFRGYLFGQLFKREKWGFIPASIIASIFFGLGHLYQTHNMGSAFATFLITFMGSAWFAWLYIEHNSNLWVAIWLHIFMNMSWTIFQTDVPGAVGTNSTNLFRLVTIIITVIYTIRYSKKHGFKVNKANLVVNNSGQ